MNHERLIGMANQIGQFFRAQGEAAIVDGVENHLRSYWDPRMRREIIALVDSGVAGLDPGVRAAVERIRSSPNNA